MALIAFIGYAPDADPTTPGVILDCNAMLPSTKGMKAAPSAVSTGLTLAAASRGAATVRKLDGSTRVFAGSASRLYEASGGAWTDRTVDTAGYSLSGEYRWRFAQFGDVTLAAAKTDIMQRSTDGAFSRVSTSPAIKAAIIETVENFVMAFDTSDTAFGDSPNRWWCSAIRDYTDWTPAVATQCASNTLVATPGRITAGKRFGETIIAYKLRSMYRGTYVGQPDIWIWPVIPGDIGALCNEAVVDIGTGDFPLHAFMSDHDFYVYDGSRPRSIGDSRVRDLVFNEINHGKQASVIGQHDRANSVVRWYYPVADSVNPEKCIVWNYRTNKWGRDDRQIEAALEYIAAGLTYDQLGSSYATYHDLPDAPFDSAFAGSDTARTAVFNTNHQLVTLDGTPGASSLTTGDLGDDATFTCVHRIRPRFSTAPTSASLTNYYRINLGDSLIADSGASLESGKFDFMREARWHRFLMQFSGAVELSGYTPVMTAEGEE